MIGDHLEDEELLEILDNDDDLHGVEAARLHLDVCDDCRERYESFSTFTQALRDQSVHLFARRAFTTRPFPEGIEDLLERLDENAQENQEAEGTFVELRVLAADGWLAHLRARPASITAGLVRRVVQEARAEFDSRPQHALLLLDIALELSNALTRDALTLAELRGTIAKERGEALRMLGRYPEALESLDHAERLIAELPAPTYDLALVERVRAAVLFSMSRYADALPLVHHAVKVLRQHGDLKGAEETRFIEANILCEEGDVRGAHRIFSRLAAIFEGLGDREIVARVNANLAECEVRLDNRDVAYEYAADAMRIYDELGYESEKIRVRWILGHALMRQSHTEEALVELRDAAAAFDSLGMVVEAGDVGLDLAELYLGCDEWAEAEALARDLSMRFVAARAPVHQARAFAYLREAVEARTATAELLEYLRTYLATSANQDGPAPFEPPVS